MRKFTKKLICMALIMTFMLSSMASVFAAFNYETFGVHLSEYGSDDMIFGANINNKTFWAGNYNKILYTKDNIDRGNRISYLGYLYLTTYNAKTKKYTTKKIDSYIVPYSIRVEKRTVDVGPGYQDKKDPNNIWVQPIKTYYTIHYTKVLSGKYYHYKCNEDGSGVKRVY